ncbi:MAG: hypothetical protein MJ188_11485 [Treponema sp.]|nr:hypothetical protein [Treponema sp.]
MKLVTIDKDEIRLNSFMDELSFGKTNYNSIVTQEGLLATCSWELNENNSPKDFLSDNMTFSFSPWTFSEIKSFAVPEDNKSIVFYCGKNPLSAQAKTLLELYEAAGDENASLEDKDKMFDASFVLCSILTQAAKEKVNLPINGGGGIIFDFVDEENLQDSKNYKVLKVLFLPPNLYKYSSSGLSAVEYADNYLCWVNPTLYDLPAICFERAVIAYKMLTGRFPYPASDSTERNADILDRKFLPVDLCVNGINEELAQHINKALKLNSNAFAIPGKKKKGKNSEDLTPTPDFPLDLLLKAKTSTKTSRISDEALAAKAQNYIKHRDSRINAKRTLRRNTSILVTSAIVITIVGLITGNAVKNNQDNYSSRGLTSTETVEMFFKGVNEKDTVILDNIVSGKGPSRYVDTISQIYVLNKSRQAYNYGDKGFAAPETWCFFVKNAAGNAKAGIYGVTNVEIDGKLYELEPPLYKKKDKAEIIKEENGIAVQKGSKSVHIAEYYLLHTEGEAGELTVEKATDTFTLTFDGTRWLITEISSDVHNLNIDDNLFKADWYNAMIFANDNPIRAVQVLKGKYYWLPTDHAMEKEKIRLEEEAKNPFGIKGL